MKKGRDSDWEDVEHRSTGLMSFGSDVRRLLKPLLGKKGFIEADILSHWEDILGSSLSCGVIPTRVSFSKTAGKGATLHVTAYSGAFALEFTARKDQILEKINSYFGYSAITEIRLSQGSGFTPLAEKDLRSVLDCRIESAVKEQTSCIENTGLREAATELGILLSETKK